MTSQTLDDAGTALTASGLSFSPFGLPQSGATPEPFGFTGELHHNDLVYLRARWYDPGSGTFTSVDPFDGFQRMPYSLHPYQYAYAAPTMWTDPSGELAIFVSGRNSETEAIDDLSLSASGVWVMADRVAPRLIGPTIIASWNTTSRIAEEIRRYAEECRSEIEPLILVGYSLGGRTVMYLSHGDLPAEIDLVITFDPATGGHGHVGASRDLISRKGFYVKEQLNFTSDPTAPHPSYENNGVVIYGIGVVTNIHGATNETIDGANHQNIDDEYLSKGPDVVNIGWQKAVEAILATGSSYLR
jgi:RHS repeat-associated protein